MNPPNKRFYAFASFRVDLAERKVWREEQLTPLRPKLFDLLVVLLEHRGRTLEREELLKAVWGDNSMGDPAAGGGSGLSVNISALRRVLGDDPEHPQFIETSPKHGYRFVGEVREWTEPASDHKEIATTATPTPSHSEAGSPDLAPTVPLRRDWWRHLKPYRWLALPGAIVFMLLGARFLSISGTRIAPP
jgi:DNA-binding winged helix-turn-helix (wHTH) protein